MPLGYDEGLDGYPQIYEITLKKIFDLYFDIYFQNPVKLYYHYRCGAGYLEVPQGASRMKRCVDNLTAVYTGHKRKITAQHNNTPPST